MTKRNQKANRPIGVGDRVESRLRPLVGVVVHVEPKVFGLRTVKVAWDGGSEQLCHTSDLRRPARKVGTR